MPSTSSAALGPSAKQQLILTAERLFATHGVDGVPLRQIGTAAGMGNKSAVQYHFGSKEALLQAILASRLEHLTRRRTLLEARMRVDDLRSVVEAHQLPLMELAEDEDCYYLPFLEQVLHHRGPEHPLATLPPSHVQSHQAYVQRVGDLIDQVPQRLRNLRIHYASLMCVHACADRHHELVSGSLTLSYAEHVSHLLDGVVAFLAAAPSAETMAALKEHSADPPALRALP
ncbi:MULTISPECIES: TetR/AcrR family transcriptional regulator [unclassified Mycobacterium]|uniref:TetR/AcrR family transcriptional regulator n=1 Tax=unclassified Mycobacterium TaxID=2642494 RepID=UPI0029C9864E|nr:MULTISPECIES: TetR/AcrR family transcriptional regulator [unclassified Mycobacterium]